MAIILRNSNLKLKIETPGEKYRGSRFDWNGTVTQIWYKGKKMLSEEKLPFHRDAKIYGRGLHNEFGIKNCIGYDEIPVGEYFPKIGTGWLKKDDKPYFFYTQYKLEPLEFSWQKISDIKAVFMCDSGEKNGYAYRYAKVVELKDDSFSISYSLENQGEKNISTTEYVHNFLLPGQKKVGPQLTLQFPWEYSKEALSENVKTEGLIEWKNDGCSFKKTPESEFFLGGVWEARNDKNSFKKGSWILRDDSSGITMSESDSFEPYHCDVWGHKKCISPELFIWLDVKPGEEKSWSRTYSFTMN